MTRQILHLDMNSYFASVEQQANPLLRGKPIAVSRKPQDRTIAAAVSKEAKVFGLKSGMPSWEVRRRCPSITFVPGDPAKYAFISGRIFTLMKTFSPFLEVFSIDEAFLDITPIVERHGGPEQLARKIKRAIHSRLGASLTCSIGVAPSKVVAKIASESKKPDGLVVVPPEGVQTLLERTPITKACGLDEGWQRRLSSRGIETLADLGRVNATWLRQRFGIVGHYLHLIGQGKDPSPLNPNAQALPPKSFGHSRVFAHPWPSWDEAQDVLYLLCYKTCRRMRLKKFCGRVVHFFASGNEGNVSRQRALPLPTDDEEVVYKTCLAIARTLCVPPEIRIIGVSVGGLRRSAAMPVPLFPQARRRAQLLGAMDALNEEWGDFTVYFGGLQPIKDRVSWNVASLGMHREVEAVG